MCGDKVMDNGPRVQVGGGDVKNQSPRECERGVETMAASGSTPSHRALLASNREPIAGAYALGITSTMTISNKVDQRWV